MFGEPKPVDLLKSIARPVLNRPSGSNSVKFRQNIRHSCEIVRTPGEEFQSPQQMGVLTTAPKEEICTLLQ